MKAKITTKLIISFGVIIILSIFLGIFSFLGIKSLNDKSKEISDVWLLGVDLAHTMNTAISDYRIKEYKHAITNDINLMTEIEKEIKDLKDEFEKALNEYESISVLQNEKDEVATIKADYNKYIEIDSKVLQLSRDLKSEEAINMLHGQSRESFDTLSNDVVKLVKLNQEQAQKVNEANKETYNKVRLMLIIIIVSIAAVSIVMSIYMVRQTKNRTEFIKGFINKTANFDLVYNHQDMERINKYKDEFGDMAMALVAMRKALREIIIGVKGTARKVSTNSENLSTAMEESYQSIEGVAKAIEQMAQGSTDLAKSVQDGAAKLETLAVEINEAARSSGMMKETVGEVSKVNSEGMESIRKLKGAVGTNIKATVKVASQVDLLDNKSESIGKIAETIKFITAQINLLSLNAAIEAARAGEQGRGFAVVAEEIRKLASETNRSTKEIDNIVNEVRNEIMATKSEMEKVEGAIKHTGEVSKNTEKAFDDINKAVSNIIGHIGKLVGSINNIDKNKNEVVGNISDISATAEESASTTEEISASTQQQSAGAEQVSQSAEDLKVISKELEDLIAKFRT